MSKHVLSVVATQDHQWKQWVGALWLWDELEGGMQTLEAAMLEKQ